MPEYDFLVLKLLQGFPFTYWMFDGKTDTLAVNKNKNDISQDNHERILSIITLVNIPPGKS